LLFLKELIAGSGNPHQLPSPCFGSDFMTSGGSSYNHRDAMISSAPLPFSPEHH
jgi:hypothetical protein